MAAKYLEIAEALRLDILAGRWVPGALLPTESALCESFGASRQTIRQALQTLVNQGYIYRRQGSGSRVLSRESHTAPIQRTVAVIATYIGNYIFPSTLRDVERVFSANNCTMQLAATSNHVDNERRILLGLLEQKLDGILVEGTKTAMPNPNLDLYRKFQEKGIPLVFFHGYYRELEPSVAILADDFGGGLQLARYLAEKGHTRIAGIFKSDDIQGHRRYAGFAAGLRELDLPLEDSHLFWFNTENKPLPGPAGESWAERVMPVLEGCTAVVCYNDEVASALTQYLLRRRVRIPQELAVVSFDNSHYSELSTCRITSLSHGGHSIGRIAAEALMDAMEGREAHSQTIPWQLVEKESG